NTSKDRLVRAGAIADECGIALGAPHPASIATPTQMTTACRLRSMHFIISRIHLRTTLSGTTPTTPARLTGKMT
ncbi:MAG TPA: hypothetical protein VKR56_12465, partial [Candidatus Cybelea sp.]|nr:hypothetical protein [Candidatus Cybelea sp.]